MRLGIVHEGSLLESGYYKTHIINSLDSTIIEFNDTFVQQESGLSFNNKVSAMGYLFFYENQDSKTLLTDLDLKSNENHFRVSTNEEKFVSVLWASCDEKNLHSVALREERTKDFLSFHQLAMINSIPKPSVSKRLKFIYRNYRCGWLSDFLVDFYITQLCKLVNEDIKSGKFGAKKCNITAEILNKQSSPTSYITVSKRCFNNGKFCKTMFFPLLENRHFTLYVLDNIRKKIICFDSMSSIRDTRRQMVEHEGGIL